MKKQTRINAFLLLAGCALVWWFLPTIGNLAAMRPQAQPAQYAPAQPLFVAPAPSRGEAPAQPIYNEPAPTAVIIMQPVLSSPTIAAAPTAVVMQEPAKDWTEEITAVNRNLESATRLIEVCARDKIAGALEFPPRLVNCSPVVENLNRAKEKIEELQLAIRESNQ